MDKRKDLIFIIIFVGANRNI